MEKGFALFKRPVPAGEHPEGLWASWSRAEIGHRLHRALVLSVEFEDGFKEVEKAVARASKITTSDQSGGSITSTGRVGAPDGSMVSIPLTTTAQPKDGQTYIEIRTDVSDQKAEAGAAKLLNDVAARLKSEWVYVEPESP